ncbi:MAG: hypothetical protein ABW167_19615 [Baekduia sp.]
MPLDAHQRERLRAAGTLAEDYRSRSVTEYDFVQVEAADDAAARDEARLTTKLVFKGETAEFHESMGDSTYRELAAA